jgi:hypothetical protein
MAFQTAQRGGGMAIFLILKDGHLMTQTKIVKPEMLEYVKNFLMGKIYREGTSQLMAGGVPVLEEGEWEKFYEDFQIVNSILKRRMLDKIKNILGEAANCKIVNKK